MKYPFVYSEESTMSLAVQGQSIARFGDGELRLALGEGKHIAQVQDQRLSFELRDLLAGVHLGALICIPNAEAPNGKPLMWGPTRYSSERFVELYKMPNYGSSFVTRPDSAPWIDTESYWLLCRKLWEGKDVTLVIGTRGGSLTYLHHAKSVRLIYGPERDAYEHIGKLMDQIGTPDHNVLICLGPTATCLANRLAIRGVRAYDLGHIGRFMPQKFLQAGEDE